MYILKLKFFVLSFMFFKDILNRTSLIFTLTLFLADSLQKSKLDFIMFNVFHMSLQNAQTINCR